MSSHKWERKCVMSYLECINDQSIIQDTLSISITHNKENAEGKHGKETGEFVYRREDANTIHNVIYVGQEDIHMISKHSAGNTVK